MPYTTVYYYFRSYSQNKKTGNGNKLWETGVIVLYTCLLSLYIILELKLVSAQRKLINWNHLEFDKRA